MSSTQFINVSVFQFVWSIEISISNLSKMQEQQNIIKVYFTNKHIGN